MSIDVGSAPARRLAYRTGENEPLDRSHGRTTHSVSVGSGNVASTCSLVANEAGVSASTSDLDNRFLMSVTNISPKTEFNHAGTMKFDTSRTSQIFAPGEALRSRWNNSTKTLHVRTDIAKPQWSSSTS